MKPTLLSLAFALVSPFAFAQTSPGNGETENPITPKVEAATTTTDGSVSAFAPDEMIAVITAGGESMSFVIGPAAKYQDTAGNDVDASAIKEGIKVQVTAETNGDQMVASRIVVDS
jgi:hypothetical protein